MKQVIIYIVLFCLATAGFSQEKKGKIAGIVTDKNSEETLAGVNIQIKGTYMGAATDADGAFIITEVSAGTYDIEASMIGYKIQLITAVEVEPGKTKVVNFEIEESVLAYGQEIEVIGEKPLMEVDQTSSEAVFSASEIEKAIVENLDDIVAQQAGVVKKDGEIHIRGGRADESMYIIDGVSVKDPLSGYGSTVYVNADAIKELKVVTGGFNAEYGQAMSGIIDVVTKEGDDQFSGSFSIKTDNLGLGLLDQYNTQILEFNFGGPELVNRFLLEPLGVKIPGEMTFFVSGYGNISDTYLKQASKLYPSRSGLDLFAPRQENDWHVLGKLTWKPTPGRKISLSYDRSLSINQGYFRRYLISQNYYPYNFSENLDHYPTFTNEAILGNLTWFQTLNQTTFFEITLSDFFNSTHSAVQNKHWTEYQEKLDLYPIYYIPQEGGNAIIRRGDGFYDYGDYDEWYDYFSDRWSIHGDITSQIGQNHNVKAGLEVAMTEMQVIDIIDPWVQSESGFGRNYDIYNVTSYSGFFYAQDQIKYEGMIVNIGMRYDYWFPGKFVEDAINDPETIIISDEARRVFKDETFKVFGMRGKGHLSPRLGISHPVSDNDVLYFHYGHFSQQPKGQYVYAKLKSTSAATYQLFGNPNLNPTTTVAYELGIKHKFTENLVMDLRAYYKDMFDYPTAENVKLSNPRYGNLSFLMYFNQDYARAKGIELRVKQRYAQYLSGTLNFSYGVSKGKSSSPNDNLLVASGSLSQKSLSENYLSWDTPIRITLDLNFDIDKNQNLSIFSMPLPKDWGASLHWELESGKRYTQLIDIENEIYDETNPYGKLAPYWQQFDLRLYKYYEYFGATFVANLEIENLFDAKIPRIINPYTGREYRPGDILTNSYTRDYNPNPNPIYNPSKYRWPRTIRLGLSVKF
ncbi:MAG: TonB-dependent receptor [Calditrichaeota bacterium]|nr:TonB-dependent receptor [Calditrichota bacterium]